MIEKEIEKGEMRETGKGITATRRRNHLNGKERNSVTTHRMIAEIGE